MKILLIDDEIVALNALKKRVDWVKYGFTEIFTAQDIADAKEIINKENIDMILCDIEMQGENGLSLIEHVKDTHPDICSIMVTCHADFNYIKRAMRYGVKDYILKPIDYEELEGLLLQFKEEKELAHEKQQFGRLVEKTKEVTGKDTRGRDPEQAADRNRIIKEYIDSHIQEKITVKDLANLVHVNEQHLMRIFKKENGQSILEYINERRIVIASNLLKDTDYTINFIADCIGCENYSYFTKIFKKYTGFTPREYRMQFKKG